MKVVLVGPTGSGKSTVAPRLGRTLGLQVLEIDDETVRLNGGSWPETEAVIDALFERIVPNVLEMDRVLFVTSWLEPGEITAFYERGFAIAELHATPAELVKRKLERGDSLADGRFYKNYPVYREIHAGRRSQGLTQGVSRDDRVISGRSRAGYRSCLERAVKVRHPWEALSRPDLPYSPG